MEETIRKKRSKDPFHNWYAADNDFLKSGLFLPDLVDDRLQKLEMTYRKETDLIPDNLDSLYFADEFQYI